MTNFIPGACDSVKCMVQDCQNLASHKIVEENIWNYGEENEEREKFDRGIQLSSYLCDYHFNLVMTRDTNYSMKDQRNFLRNFKEINDEIF